MEAERYSLTLHFSATIFLPLSVAGPASPSSLGVLRSMSFGCGSAALGPFVVELDSHALAATDCWSSSAKAVLG